MNKLSFDKLTFWMSLILNWGFYFILLISFLNLEDELLPPLFFGALLFFYIPPILLLILIVQIILIVVNKIKQIAVAKIIWAALILNFITIVIYALSFVPAYQLSDRGPLHKDSRKILDLGNVERALEFYHEKYQSYPHVEEAIATERWQQLTNQIVNSDIGITDLPQDPDFPRQSYDYQDGNDGKKFVLKTILIISNADKYRDDVDGIIFGIDCGPNSPEDKEYCLAR